MTQTETEKNLGVGEVADALGVSRPTVRRLIEDRRLTALRVGRHWKISDRELERFRADNTTQALASADREADANV